MNKKSQEKLTDIIKKLEDTKDTRSSKWKKIVEANKEEFSQIKLVIKEKQQELRKLIQQKNSLLMDEKEFEQKVDEIQDELTELEFKILKLRIS